MGLEKIFFRSTMIMLCLLILGGCWDRVETNDVALIMGTGIDKEEDGYRVTVQIPLVGLAGGGGGRAQGSGQGDEKIWHNESVLAKNMLEAYAGLQERSSRRIFFGHRRVILIGEEMAKSGLDEFLDSFHRNPENRLNAFLLVTRGSAAETLSTPVHLEQTPSEKMRELAIQSMIIPQTMHRVNEMMLTPGIDPTFPIVIPHDVELDQSEGLRLDGLALFRGDQLVGMEKLKDAAGIMWLMGEVDNIIDLIPAPDGSGHITVFFHMAKVKYKPKKVDDRFVMEVEIRTEGHIMENNSTFDLRVPGNMVQLEEATKVKLTEKMKEAFHRLQTKFKSDPAGFGKEIYMSMPREWKKIESEWNETYLPQLGLEIKMMVNIIHTGSINRAIKTKELKGPNEGG